VRKALSMTGHKAAHAPNVSHIKPARPSPPAVPPAAVCNSSGACGLIGARREFLPQGVVRKARTPEQMNAAAPSLDYPATQVGTVGNMTLFYDPSLGAQGLALAQQFLNVANRPYQDMVSFFGIAGGAVQVVIAPLSGNNDGSGGAYHYGCDFVSGGTLYLDATFASSTWTWRLRCMSRN
jgi:hypothetical protein